MLEKMVTAAVPTLTIPAVETDKLGIFDQKGRTR